MNPQPLMIERTYNAPIEKVWNAITQKEQMKQWYFDLAAFEAVPGFEFSFTAQNEGKDFVHLCKVIEVIAGKKISYAWRYKGVEGDSLVSFELFPEGAQTKIKLTHSGIDSFPALPDYDRKNFELGWNHIIGSGLKEFVEKQP